MPRVVHFEIHADDPGRAVAFYAGVFGWEINKAPGPHDYWLITTGPEGSPGINGGLLRRPCPASAEGQGLTAFACTIDVPSVDEYLGKVTAAGGRLALAKMAVPMVGWLAYAKDTEGNVFGLMQFDRAAK
jgi:predicted enzyme related to lactoylglutathione lyase